MARTIIITAEVVNGQFLITPQVYKLPCNKVHPVGFQVMRTYDENMSIVARSVFLLRVNEIVLGTTQFKTKQEFLQYKATQCVCCPEPEVCYFTVNECIVTVNDCKALIECCAQPTICLTLLNGCGLTLNGCNVLRV